MNTGEDDDELDDSFPWPDVEASRNDRKLQQENSLEEARERYLEQARCCPKCKAKADELAWFYFSSPDITWEHLCGRAGWLTVCDRCRVQVDFFLEVLN